jgi:hypothetical protein
MSIKSKAVIHIPLLPRRPAPINRVDTPRITVRLSEYLKDNKLIMTKELADILSISIKEFFPTLYNMAINKGWSNYKMTYYLGNIDLSQEDLIKILQHASRLSKVWIFS